MIDRKTEVIAINKAEYLSGYKLKLYFNDGTTRIVDFEPFLRKSKHPEIQKYLDLEKFKQFKIKYGDLLWNDYELCFPIADLYEGMHRMN
ncbi:MAG: DUF2442 domain-containing protein [Calditrichaeota bacterium]|nr:MAG: DUF2442 domain-containing protein [Calditrichota bacterium]